jgi:hypothetical protein
MRTSARCIGWAFVGASALLLGSGTARAQGAEDAAAAQALYDRATALMDEGKPSEACPMLEEVTRLIPDGLGARITLAECYEREGKLASAWALYSSTAAAALRAGQDARHDRAAQKAASLAPHLATITLNVSPAARAIDGLTVKRDGNVVNPAQWGERIPVDVGPHMIDVDAPGTSSWKREVYIARDGTSESVTVDPGAPEGASKPASLRPWQRPTGYAVGGVGIASLGVGFALGAVALSKAHASQSECTASLVCTEQGLELRKDGRSFGNAATAMIAIGAAGTALGIVLVVSAPKAHRTELALGPGMLAARGTF